MSRYLFLYIVASATLTANCQEAGVVNISGIPFTLRWEAEPASYQAEGNTMTITAGRETDLYCFVDGNYYVNTAPKILFAPDSNFILTVTIRPDFQNPYDAGALLIYSDASNWAKVIFERHEDGTLGLGSSVVRNRSGDDSYHTTISTPEVSVRLARSGRIFNFYHAPDGKNWKLLRTFPYTALQGLRIGFYAQSPRGNGRPVAFSNITYRGEKFTNYFTGE